MSASHTTAPWGDDDRKTVYVRQATFLATVHYDSAEADANTALIKAAPDLLTALKEAEAHISRASGGGETDIRAKLNAAIAKAEGR